ncbi:serine protease [Nonomuraea sp. NPDC049419]|uniref:trypsin-like serine peptidase n=1 Tax=Nonomuraea sp. NPDC049419 TaxID=3155772 RepID=UPI00341C52D8
MRILMLLAALLSPVSGLAGTAEVNGCSGALVRTQASTPDDPALVLTNGHCYEGAWPVPGEVLVDRPSHRLIRLLDDAGRPAAAVHAERAAYVTMTGTDVALYRLGTTYRRLERDHQVRPLTLAAARPAPGTRIKVLSGGLKKVFTCAIDRLAYRVLESGYVTEDVLRYTKACQTGPGSSGSPVVDVKSGQVVGINNTSNRDGGACTQDNPCEMDRDGVITKHKSIAYGTQTYWLTTCLATGNRLDLDRPGCLLPRPDPRRA